jgi:hypothetical protein
MELYTQTMRVLGFKYVPPKAEKTPPAGRSHGRTGCAPAPLDVFDGIREGAGLL